MIPLSAPLRHRLHWSRQLAEGFRTPAALLDFLGLPRHLAAEQAQRDFPMRVPRFFAGRMQPGDPADPLLLQVLPQPTETRSPPGFGTDPTADRTALSGPGVLHKYHGRALVLASGSCAVHCRYCFRRHFPYGEAGARAGRWQEVIDAIAGDATISEVILSGGDPLTLSNARLAELLGPLAALAHIRRLRIHSRLPVVLPHRLDSELCRQLAALSKPVTLVLHANHARELSPELHQALLPLRRAGITLLNQAVLLARVNDRVEAQQALCERLHDLGVLPYYLHQLDRVRGAAHFEVSDEHARAIHRQLLERLPGYLVPRLVREVPGAPGKQPL